MAEDNCNTKKHLYIKRSKFLKLIYVFWEKREMSSNEVNLNTEDTTYSYINRRTNQYIKQRKSINIQYIMQHVPPLPSLLLSPLTSPSREIKHVM